MDSQQAQVVINTWLKEYNGAVRRMRTRIGLLAQPESMRSIVGATQRERRRGLA